MIYFDFGPYDTDKIFVGTRTSHKNFPNGNCVLIAGNTEEIAHSIARRSIGDRVANPGFAFTDDDVVEWLQPVDAHTRQSYQGFASDLDKLKVLLGSIELIGYSITHRSKDEVVEFQIETTEAGKIRILSSRRGKDDIFEALPSEFSFTPYWLSKLIIDQY